jgi:hypothetical protein
MRRRREAQHHPPGIGVRDERRHRGQQEHDDIAQQGREPQPLEPGVETAHGWRRYFRADMASTTLSICALTTRSEAL